MTGERVGIMSMQRIFNYGSSLQAYALRRLVETARPGAEVEFLDYRPGEPLITDEATERGRPWQRTWAKAVASARADAPVADRLRFLNHKRRYARDFFPDLGIAARPGALPSSLDVQIIGSDEVFNCVQSNRNVGYSRDLFGHDSPAERLTSYAASFGNTTIAKIDAQGLRGEIADDLSRFSALSVRDANSAAVVEDLTGRRPQIHVDPVIAFDYAGNEPRVPSRRLHPRPYVVVYGYSGRLTAPENAVVARVAEERGADVLSFGGLQSCATRFVDCHPFELLAYFRDAEAVVTDTFHGTIFSLLSSVPFATIVRPSHGSGYGNEEKLTDLLARFGLEDRRADGVDAVEHLLSEPLDVAAVGALVAQERERSRDYLRHDVMGA